MNLLGTDAPLLPLQWVMQWVRPLAWGIVLAWLAVLLLGVLFKHSAKLRTLQIRAAVVVGVVACVPGTLSPTYWLGQAFQMPSLVSVLLCGVLLYRTLTQRWVSEAVVRSSRNSLLALGMMGVLLGWVLLLDTFALLPVQVYAWGFSPAALGLLLLATLMPWALSLRGPLDPVAWTAPVALLLFVLLRLPTGNVWDAVLDPWLWLVLQWLVLRCWRGRG
jgi:hypothetical protein